MLSVHCPTWPSISQMVRSWPELKSRVRRLTKPPRHLYKFSKMFIYFERETDHKQRRGRERQRGRETETETENPK